MADRPEQDERTEEATPRRREEAREKGQVAMSSELVAALMLLTAAIGFAVGGGWIARSAGRLVHASASELGTRGTGQLATEDAGALFGHAARTLGPPILVVLLPVLLVGVVAGYAQVGVRVAPKAVEFDPQKLDPMQGLKRTFGARGWVRTGTGFLKIGLVLAAVGSVAWLHVPEVATTAGGDVRPVVAAMGHVLLRGALAGIVVVLLLSLIDVAFQRWQHSRDLRMTRKEVKDEAKNTEGDPLVRSRIRQVQRELASRRMMSDVPDATVVVTNPTHVAVALRYEDGVDSAPRVVAKGLDEVAQRIKDVAREHGVVVYEEPPLARALHGGAEIGDTVPEELFEAVARVLAYVYRIRGGRPQPAGAEA